MDRYDMFIVEDKKIKYDKTYYHNKKTNKTEAVKEESVTLEPGFNAMLKLLSNLN